MSRLRSSQPATVEACISCSNSRERDLLRSPAKPSGAGMPDVVITHDRTRIEAAIEEALGAIALEPLVSGRLVAVKPNDTWAVPGDTTGITQPDTLRAVL